MTFIYFLSTLIFMGFLKTAFFFFIALALMERWSETPDFWSGIMAFIMAIIMHMIYIVFDKYMLNQ